MGKAREPGRPRILTLDIENSPHLAYTYDLYDARITPDKIIQPARILCWAAKWLDRREVIFRSEYHDDTETMLDDLWQLLDQADLVVTYNGKGHDLPIILKTFLENGYGPPSPWHDIDLYRAIRGRYKFASNRLGYVTEALGLPTKLETGVAQLWKRVLEDDDHAWTKFRAYNKRDVVVSELLFRVMAPWLKLPHTGLWSGDMTTCPACGSRELTPAGITTTKTSAYARCVCRCGAWCKVLPSGQTRPI